MHHPAFMCENRCLAVECLAVQSVQSVHLAVGKGIGDWRCRVFGRPPTQDAIVTNEGSVRDFPILKMVHNPGGDWHPVWGVVANIAFGSEIWGDLAKIPLNFIPGGAVSLAIDSVGKKQREVFF